MFALLVCNLVFIACSSPGLEGGCMCNLDLSNGSMVYQRTTKFPSVRKVSFSSMFVERLRYESLTETASIEENLNMDCDKEEIIIEYVSTSRNEKYSFTSSLIIKNLKQDEFITFTLKNGTVSYNKALLNGSLEILPKVLDNGVYIFTVQLDDEKRIPKVKLKSLD